MLTSWLWVMGLAWAERPENISYGELYGHGGGWSGNALTTPKKMLKLHPFLRSAYGVSDKLDLKFGTLGQLFGPEGGGELVLVGGQPDGLTLSFETYTSVGWNFNQVQSLHGLHASFPVGEGLLTVTAMGGVAPVVVDTVTEQDGDTTRVTFITENQWALRPEIALDIPLSDRWMFTGTARTGVQYWATGVPNGALGMLFGYGRELVGVSLGVNVLYGGFTESVSIPEGTVEIPNLLFMPLPHFQLWFRI